MRVSTATIKYSNRGTVFSAQSLPRGYKQDNWSNELVVRQSPAVKNLNTEVENIVVTRHQATTGEGIAN
jgi:hypothetical protein